MRRVDERSEKRAPTCTLHFSDKRKVQVLNIYYSVDNMLSTAISIEDDSLLQKIILKHYVHIRCGDINPDVVHVLNLGPPIEITKQQPQQGKKQQRKY